jgi:acetylornithine deacetylase/succinyl-diaminopimelate desuccinylase-like protein
VLSGHSDVVPVDGQDWSSDPFNAADIREGKLYGRGAADYERVHRDIARAAAGVQDGST